MPFVAPIIVAAVGLSGTAAVIGSAVVSTAISVGISYAAAKWLGPKKTASPQEVQQRRGSQLDLKMDPNTPRMLAFGKVAYAGSLVYWQFSGSSNNTLEMVIALNDWPSGALTGMYVDGKKRTIAEDGTVSDFGTNLTVRYHTGEFDQTADSTLVSNSAGAWTNNDRLAGVAYVVVKLVYSESKFPGGIPEMLFEFEGCRLYDWRKDTTAGGSGAHRWNDLSTWEYTNNPIVVLYNWRRGFFYDDVQLYGMSTPATAFLMDTYTEAANICDELVGTITVGVTEKRYTIGGSSIDTSRQKGDVIDDLLTAVAGHELESGGFYGVMVGKARNIVMDVTDADIMAGEDFRYTAKKSGADLVNAVFASCVDPAQMYQIQPLPPRTSSTDETADRERKSISVSYELVSSRSQGQRLAEITRRAARLQGSGSCTLRAKCSGLEPGDWITMTVASRGWTEKLFVVTSCELQTDHKVSVHFEEVSGTTFAFTAEDWLTPGVPGDITSVGPSFVNLTGVTATFVNVTLDGTDTARPGIRVQWDAITDATVSSIMVEYRLSGGDGTGLSKTISQPTTTTHYTWVDGVQGGLPYQVRLRPLTTPDRALEWTSWLNVAGGGNSPAQVVQVANTVLNIDPELLEGVEFSLSAQEQFELSLVTAVQSQIGSLAEAYQASQLAAKLAAEAALNTRLLAEETSSSLEVVTRFVEDGGLAQRVTVLETDTGTHTARLIGVEESVDGISLKWGQYLDVDGNIIGSIQLDGSDQTSTFSVLADTFRVAQRGAVGGEPVPVFALSQVNGRPRLTLAGDMLADGAISARSLSVVALSAIVANLGEITAGLMRSADNLFRIDLNNKTIVIETEEET